MWTRYLAKPPELAERIKEYIVDKDHPDEPAQETECNLALAICMARVFYLRIPEELAPAKDVYGLGGGHFGGGGGRRR